MERANVEQLRAGDRIDAKYEVQRVLGKGGMGVVVAALHVDLQEVVALKFLLPEALTRSDSVERFLREARAVRKLESEYVVKVLDVGRLSDSGLPYMAMELLVGEDLERLVLRAGPLPIGLACTYVSQACEALAEAHANGIVHRDIKPANLFALSAPKRGRPTVKVLDFGIAKVLEPDGISTRTQAVVGSAYYMAPEQMRSSKTVDARADIWAMGVTLFELLTARHPFEGSTLPELVLVITSDAPPSPRTLRPDLPPGLEAIIAKCLEKSPDARFQSIVDLAAALAPYVGNEAVTAGPVAIDRPSLAEAATISSDDSILHAPAPSTTPTHLGPTQAAESSVPSTLPSAIEASASPQTGTGLSVTQHEPARSNPSRRPALALAALLGTMSLAAGAMWLNRSESAGSQRAAIDRALPSSSSVSIPSDPATQPTASVSSSAKTSTARGYGVINGPFEAASGQRRRAIVRETPAFNAKEVTRLETGTLATVIGLQEGWYKIRWPHPDGKDEGWVHRDVFLPGRETAGKPSVSLPAKNDAPRTVTECCKATSDGQFDCTACAP